MTGIESAGPDVIKIACGSSRCDKWVGANVARTDKGLMLTYTRCLGTSGERAPSMKTSEGLPDDFVGIAPDDATRRLRGGWNPPAPYEHAVDLIHSQAQHPPIYDGMWCEDHGLRQLVREDLLEALRLARPVVLCAKPQH